MTVLLTTAKFVTQSRGKSDSGLNADEINEFNLQSNKDRKKVKVSDMYEQMLLKNKTDLALSLLP